LLVNELLEVINHRVTELTEKGREHRGAEKGKERKRNRICRIAFGGRIDGGLTQRRREIKI
jgi:hypothetical protein